MSAKSIVSNQVGYLCPSSPVNIAQGDTISGVLNCAGMSLVGIITPNVLTGTALTFLVGDSALGFQANGEASFTDVPSDNDTITINGVVITFVASGPTGNQVLIGADATANALALYNFLIASSVAGLVACTYALNATIVTVTAVVPGVAGNAYTFAKSSSAITLTPSGGTLTGGGFRPLYASSGSQVSITVAAGRVYAVDPTPFQGVQFLQIKSGSTELAPRTLICSLKGL